MEDPDNQQQAPLISNRDRGDDYEDVLDDAVGPAASLDTGKASSPGLFMWLLTFSAGIGGLLFGCTKQLLSHCLLQYAHPPALVSQRNKLPYALLTTELRNR